MPGHVTIIGLGNIGSALADLLARLPEIRSLTLVDPGAYDDASNLRTQAISRAELGLAKARAQARRLKRVRPDLQITAHVATVESLPLGALKSDVICSCVDTRFSRIYINEAAFRLGTPWIDSGVLASEMLARVELFLPVPEAPCLECAFGEQHYATMEVRHPCQKGATSAAPTNAPAYLGALAASLQAAACAKMLHGRREEIYGGEQVLYGLDGHQHFVSRNRRNPDCRFDHRVFAPQEISGRLCLKELLFAQGMGPSSESTSLCIPGQRFLRTEPCRRCGRKGPAFVSVRAGDSPNQRCRFCGETSPMHPAMLQERLFGHEMPAGLLARTPYALGLRPGDLFTVQDRDTERHYLLGERSKGRRSD